jgi:hypothetical protein
MFQKYNMPPFVKGNVPWNKGLTKESDIRVKLYSEKIIGDKNYQWKGEKVSYRELHKWINNKKGTPSFCESCGFEDAKNYDWACIDEGYNRNLEDYIRLCRKCHVHYDDIYTKAWKTKRAKE